MFTYQKRFVCVRDYVQTRVTYAIRHTHTHKHSECVSACV